MFVEIVFVFAVSAIRHKVTVANSDLQSLNKLLKA